jgi:hypothetical protein
LPVKKRGDLYRLDFAESKCGNQIAPLSTVFERRVFKVKHYNFIKIYISLMGDFIGQIVAYISVEFLRQR